MFKPDIYKRINSNKLTKEYKNYTKYIKFVIENIIKGD